ncbi:histidine phosphatase family protein [Lactococcus taiwanensis]|uniref:histidine phosphatase family protein n=1 Tax=Lactococcus taiwanensis TaxID=1151742 RepID=UPI003D0BA353
MTQFYFVRHGETRTNSEGRFNGATVDTPLTTEGIAKIILLGENLKSVEFSEVYASPLSRALETAHLLMENNSKPREIIIKKELREMDLGSWDGTIVSTNQNHPQFDNYFHHPEIFDPSSIGGETYTHLIQRGQRVLQQIYNKNENNNVLIVSHGIFLMSVMKYLLGESISEIRNTPMISNCSLTILETRNGQIYKKIQWNKTFD